ncbi:MAG: GIY-YIG nuclease family protein [Ruminococcaceae bacterium]|nr:GIY-YIG nuclease family protein [Oscillospiraceae bacterium]
MWAYLLRCRDGSLYAGWTTDLEKRLAAHNAGRGAKYTRGRRPVALVWAEAYENKNAAMAQEARMKRMTKAQKEALVLQNQSNFNMLVKTAAFGKSL